MKLRVRLKPLGVVVFFLNLCISPLYMAFSLRLFSPFCLAYFFVSSVLVCIWCGDLRLKSFRVRQQLLIFVVGSNHSSYSQTHEVRGLVDVLCSSRLRL